MKRKKPVEDDVVVKPNGLPKQGVQILMSKEKGDLLEALFAVKKEIKGVVKKSDNPFFKSSYADLNQHLETVEPILEENGLMLLQPTTATDSGNYVVTTIFHVKTSQFISSVIMVPALRDAQKVGAAITYFRRFGINSLLSLKSLDDDGETAVGRGKNKKKKNRRISEEF